MCMFERTQMLYSRQLQYQQSEQLVECEDCVRRLLCVWSPHTGLLGLEGDERGWEKGEEERGRNQSKEREREKERGGHGDDHAVSLEGDLTSGNPPGTTSSSLHLRSTDETDMLVRTYVTGMLVCTNPLLAKLGRMKHQKTRS
jgi:hypothetical protein